MSGDGDVVAAWTDAEATEALRYAKEEPRRGIMESWTWFTSE